MGKILQHSEMYLKADKNRGGKSNQWGWDISFSKLVSKKEQSIVKTVDDDILYYELLTLLNETADSPAPKMYSKFS